MALSKASKIIAEAKRPERTVELCLRPDLVAAYEDARREQSEARERERTSLSDDGGLNALKEKAEAILAEMRDHTVVFRFRALNRFELRAILADNPARQGDREDAKAGFNTDAVTYALLRGCLYEPVLSDEEWDALVGPEDRVGDGILSPSQFARLDEAVSALNFARVDIPF